MQAPAQIYFLEVHEVVEIQQADLAGRGHAQKKCRSAGPKKPHGCVVLAVVALAGIVVNNSIILVTTIELRAQTQDLREAIIDGVCDRLRAILLTTATTIGGLSPLLFEKSLQAQFLIPMALTIVFGLGCAALLVLFVVPSLMALLEDVRRILRRPAPAAAQA